MDYVLLVMIFAFLIIVAVKKQFLIKIQKNRTLQRYGVSTNYKFQRERPSHSKSKSFRWY